MSKRKAKHALTGNSNAVKGCAKSDSFLHIRLPAKAKTAYLASAANNNLTLTEWVLKHLDAAVKDDE